MFEETSFLKYNLWLRHYNSSHLRYFHLSHYLVFVVLQTLPECAFCRYNQLAKLQGDFLALLEESLLVHFVLCQDVFWVGFLVQVWAAMIEAIRSFEEKAAVFRTSERRVHQSTVENVLVYRQDGDWSLSLSLVLYVGRVADSLILTLKRFLLVYCYILNFTILSEILESLERVFFGHIGRKSDYIEGVPL